MCRDNLLNLGNTNYPSVFLINVNQIDLCTNRTYSGFQPDELHPQRRSEQPRPYSMYRGRRIIGTKNWVKTDSIHITERNINL